MMDIGVAFGRPCTIPGSDLEPGSRCPRESRTLDVHAKTQGLDGGITMTQQVLPTNVTRACSSCGRHQDRTRGPR